MNTFYLAFLVFGGCNAGFLAPQQFLAPNFLHHQALYAPAAVGARLVVPPGSGLEGQYLPDHIEKLYDDGSYKPQLETVKLAPSPYGLTPAGSGLEGQYVPDLTEKLHDDGSYKPQLEQISLSPSPYGLTPSGSGLEGQYVPELQAVKLIPSPFGYVPAGSGLEGAYVPDLNEKLYDDGSYKPGFYASAAPILKAWH